MSSGLVVFSLIPKLGSAEKFCSMEETDKLHKKVNFYFFFSTVLSDPCEG